MRDVPTLLSSNATDHFTMYSKGVKLDFPTVSLQNAGTRQSMTNCYIAGISGYEGASSLVRSNNTASIVAWSAEL